MNNQNNNQQQGGFSPYILAQMIAPGNIQQPGLYPAGNQPGDIYYGADGIHFNRLGIGTEGQYLTVTDNVPAWGTLVIPSVPTDGWISTTDSFAYVSTKSFKISGVNRTTVYTKGTRIKFTNNSVTYYGVVASSSFSTDTTVTLIGNNDYSINNSTITNPFYSYEVNPQGYPNEFSITPTLTGSGSITISSLSVGYSKFSVIGNMMIVRFQASFSVSGTGSELSLLMPVTMNSTDAMGSGSAFYDDTSTFHIMTPYIADATHINFRRDGLPNLTTGSSVLGCTLIVFF